MINFDICIEIVWFDLSKWVWHLIPLETEARLREPESHQTPLPSIGMVEGDSHCRCTMNWLGMKQLGIRSMTALNLPLFTLFSPKMTACCAPVPNIPSNALFNSSDGDSGGLWARSAPRPKLSPFHSPPSPPSKLSPNYQLLNKTKKRPKHLLLKTIPPTSCLTLNQWSLISSNKLAHPLCPSLFAR